ncbi:MAG: DNA translocase FtsK [Phycisphaerales bacterium]
MASSLSSRSGSSVSGSARRGGGESAGRGSGPGLLTPAALQGGLSGLRALSLLAQSAMWVFLVLALLSFSPADAPSHLVFPLNQTPANWCGGAGAFAAYHAFNLLGLGAWVGLVLWGVHLLVTAFVTRVGHVPLRALGVLLMCVAIAGLQALVAPHSGPIGVPGSSVLGSNIVMELAPRFGALGTALWLLCALLVGATIAVDIWVILAPLWAYRRAQAMAGPAASAMTAAASTTARGAGLLGGLLARMRGGAMMEAGAPATPAPARRGRAPAEPREEEPDADESAAPGTIDERAGGLGGTEPFDPEEHIVADEDEDAEIEAEDEKQARAEAKKKKPAPEAQDAEPDDQEPEEPAAEEPAADEGAGKPRAFSPEELRAKIARLPLKFAATERRSATQDDLRDIQNTAELEGYAFPGLDLLEEPETNYPEQMEQFIREQATALERALKEFRIDGEVVGMESGPVITLYEVRLAPGTKVSSLSAVSSDLARSLKAINIRIVPNTVGKDTVGIEVPNPHKEKVRLKELMTKSEMFADMKLPMFLGKDAAGSPLIADLAAMPHILIAGTTGSGKSVCMSSILMSFLYTKKPNELKLVLVDPKMVELSQFKDIPHLMCPVVTEMGKAAAILEWAVRKMDERYELLMEAGVRDIHGYNALTWEELRERFNPSSEVEEARIPKKLPYMVFVIDELADLMMTASEVEGSIVRIAQKARAVGIHLILATQRPQANVVTGLIKSNMPARIAFKVSSGMDSRIVLDQKGGELLLGQGDMLYLSPRSSKLTRAQGSLVDDKEIRRVVKFMKEVAEPTFERSLMQLRTGSEAAAGLADNGQPMDAGDGLNQNDGIAKGQADPLFEKAVEIVLESQKGSVSMLQRRMAIGYTRSSRLIDAMWQAGIVGDHKGTVDRDVLITPDEWAAMKAQIKADHEAAAKAAEAGKQADLFAGAAGAAGTGGGAEAASPTGAPIAEAKPARKPPEPVPTLSADEAPFDSDDEDDDESL